MVTREPSTSASPAVHDERSLAAALALVGLAFSIIFALHEPEGVLQFDDLTHYLYARWAWIWPAYLLDDWGRPGFTALYFFPAGLSWTACRILSALLSTGAALAAFEIARTLNLRRAWLAVPLAFLQPLFFQLSQTTLTETPTAFYLALAIMLALKGHWTSSAILLSPAFVTRHEAILFLPIWVYFAWRNRIPLWRLWPILWAPLVVNLLAPLAGLRAPLDRLFIPSPSTQYGQGGWLTFFSRSLEAWGPGITLLAMIGLAPTARRRSGSMIVACIIAYFATQTLIRALGLYDSGGYARFLVPISPLIAVAALSGWHELWDPAPRPRTALLVGASMLLLWIAMERQLVLHAARKDLAAEIPQLHQAVLAIRIATVALLLLAIISILLHRFTSRTRLAQAIVPSALVSLILLATYGLCYPLRRPPEATLIDDARLWLATHGFPGREIISANVWIDFATSRKFPPNRPSVRQQIADAPVGALFAWERQFAASADHGLPLEEFQSNPSFRLVHQTPPRPGRNTPYLTIFEKTGPWDGKPRS